MLLSLLVIAALARPATAGDFWFDPVDRVLATVSANDEVVRAHSTQARPRDLAGAIALSCERRQGDPCGDGSNGFVDVDTNAGYRDIVTASIRLRGQLGESTREGFRVNRAHLDFSYRYAAAVVGREALVLGPSARTQLSWGENAPPLDHVRGSTAKPLPLFAGMRASGLYAVGQLRGPQRYRHPIVTLGRGVLHATPHLELGIVHLLELAGEGAPDLSIVDYIAEHFRRKDPTASESDTSNRRFGGDISVSLPALSMRAYYVVVFEDIRRARLIDAVRYDADHLVGIQHTRRKIAVVAEYAQTGVRSQEHTPRTTGFTHGGYAVGSPLGPDSQSIYASARFNRERYSVTPWLEHVQLRSDTYRFVVDGAISPTMRGRREFRYRAGFDGRFALRKELSAEVQLRYERVTNFVFVGGDSRNHFGVTASVMWYPPSRLEPLRRR